MPRRTKEIIKLGIITPDTEVKTALDTLSHASGNLARYSDGTLNEAGVRILSHTISTRYFRLKELGLEQEAQEAIRTGIINATTIDIHCLDRKQTQIAASDALDNLDKIKNEHWDQLNDGGKKFVEAAEKAWKGELKLFKRKRASRTKKASDSSPIVVK